MAITNHERVGKALALLSEGLAPFVESECRSKLGDDWVNLVAGSGPPGQRASRKESATDVNFLLKAMWDEWNSIFGKVLGRSERTYVSELRDVRNRWAHQETFSTNDADRALDTAHRLLLAVSAGDEAAEVDRIRQELLRTRFAEQTRTKQRQAALVSVEGKPASGLKPWRQVITPHADVASGRYQQAEFAADLHQVWRDEAADEYGNPVEFFRRTFITDGLRELLLNAVRRWRKEGGDPVVELQTNFGGGKTHSMIALYHLAHGYKPSELPGVETMLADAKVGDPPAVTTAVLVGQMIQPGTTHPKEDGVVVHTLWGELAYQLGGAAGYELVADADRTGTSPGSALIDLFKAYGPCLILIDEWVAYARQLYGVDGLPAGSFDAQFSFAQALAEAAKSVEGTLLVVSIPASDIEVGGEGGREALERLKNVVGRVESSWRPASAEEGFEIVRRRLFDDLPAANAPERDAVVKAFSETYRSNQGEFDRECGESAYASRMTAAYPIHPELFDRLYGDWSTLDKFQRTRGVLRLMAAVIHELWRREDSSLMIMPGTVPIDDADVLNELTRYLEDGWEPVIATDVDGPNALPLRIDAENPSLGRYSATRRVARTIYLGSAPQQAAQTRGIDDRSVKLGCVQPGETPATFGDALRHLTDQATYIYVDGKRYWYSLQPSVTRLALDRAASHFSDADVDEEIRARIGTAASPRGDFAKVHVAPRAPGDVPDEPEARLVILGPEYPHTSKTDDSEARSAAAKILEERSAGARLYRNMLVFLAPDKSRLGDLQQAVRQYLAWSSIVDDGKKGSLNLDNFQSTQAESKRDQFDDAVTQRIGETFVWALVPFQSLAGSGEASSGGAEGDLSASAGGAIAWEEMRVTGSDPLAVRVSKKLKSDESLIVGYSGARLRMDLDRVPLWRGDHVGLRQLWSDYAQYLYLPRLADSGVLVGAIEDGVSKLTWEQDTFGCADAFDEASGRYVGLVAGANARVVVDDASVLVKSEVAARQLAEEAAVVTSEGAGSGAPEGLASVAAAEATEGEPAEVAFRRFYGRVSSDGMRAARDLQEVADAIVQHLAKVGDASVEMTIEVRAESSGGFPDDVRRTVTENAETLKFDAHEFEG
ncbi:MAG: AAA+ family ATPase [Acidobacteria bacterium]|nr:MAG: AAA+ family ATPase [Acidobacteriota bacterium]